MPWALTRESTMAWKMRAPRKYSEELVPTEEEVGGVEVGVEGVGVEVGV
jgi:hypothetical protein